MNSLKKIVSSHHLRFQRLKNLRQSVSWQALSILIVISLLASSLVGLSLPTRALAQHEGGETAEFLPPDTDLYLTINLEPGGDQQSKFWEVLSNWWQDPNVQAKWGELLGQMETESDIDFMQDVLPWLGPEIAMGMRHLVPAEAPEMILFVGTMDEEASEAFFFDKLLPIMVGEGEEPPTGPSGHYHGIDVLYVPDDDLYLAFPEEYILWSNNQALLESSLDLILSPSPAAFLAGTANFQEAQANLPSERVGMFYCDCENIWEGFSEQLSEGGQAALQVAILQAFSACIPSYLAASIYFTDEGIGITAYYPLPEGMTFSTEPDLLKSADIVPYDALLFASRQDVGAYWQGLKPSLQATWLELVSNLVSTLTADIFEMPFDEAIAYLDETLELNLDELWAGITPLLGGLSGMTFEEAIAYLDDTLGLNLDELWSGMVAPLLGELSGMTFEEAVAYLDETFGLNLDELWTEIAPLLGELSGMTFEEAVAYLDETFDLNLDEWWAASPVAGKILLPGMTFEEAVAYLDETFGDQWSVIALLLGELSDKSFEETIAYLDGILGLNLDGLWSELAPHLGELSGKSFEEAVAYLDETLGLNLDGLWSELAPHLSELSGMSFDEAIAYLNDTLGLNLDELWAAIPSMIEQLAQKSFEEIAACFDQVLSGRTGEFSMALLPVSSPQQMPDILLMFEVDDPAGLQQNLDDIMSAMDPWLLQVSEVPIDGVTATMFTDYYIEESGASPGYLFLDVDTTHYLVIGSTEEALRAAVEASQGSVPSLSEAEEYQGVLSLLPQTGWDLSYINIAQLLNTIVSQIPAEELSEEDSELLLSCLPLKSALACSSALVDTEGVTMTGALYLLPPPWFEQLIEGPGTVNISAPIRDLTSFDPDVGHVAANIAINILQSSEGARIEGILMRELPEEVVSGFELAAADAGVSILDVAYGVMVYETNITTGAATITLKVDRTWADNYGVDNIKIFHISDGTKEVLPTEFTGYEGNYAVFEGTSEGGLSTFGLAAVSPLATAFAISDLTISSSKVKIGESVTITATVTNTSIATGTHTVSLKLDGEVVDTKGVTLASGASETVSFTVTKDVAGTYSVEIDGSSDSFRVTSEAGTNWGLIGGIIGGVIVVAIIVAVVLLRRRAVA
jgi:tetratricopeptide (TPR) repeat protein